MKVEPQGYIKIDCIDSRLKIGNHEFGVTSMKVALSNDHEPIIESVNGCPLKNSEGVE